KCMYELNRNCQKVVEMANFRRIVEAEPLGNNGLHEGKYQSKWCSHSLALTIYVNANELPSSPKNGQPRASCLHICAESIHVRGQEIRVCLNGWVTFSSKRRSLPPSSWNKRRRRRRSRVAGWARLW